MFDKIVSLITSQLPVKPETIKPESRLIEDLGADSANIMILIMDMENEFDIVVEDEALASIKTVGDIMRYLEEHVES